MLGESSVPRVRRRLGTWLLAAIAALPITAALAATQYLYDDLGRLVLVANSDGSATVYAHDENGNVLSISQWAASGPVIAGFSPMFGHAGTPVTILGAGFSATPANNSVTIGGLAATVSAATATTIVSSIPQGADTGPITVTVGGVTAVSDHNITVYKPHIASFSPTLVAPGASVTIIGANLNLVAGGTSISVGGATATITSLANNQAVITAPASSSGGRIVVNTPYGQSQSATNLAIVPTSIGAANVVAQATVEAGGSAASLAINQQNKYALLQFDAAPNAYYSVQASAITTTPPGAWVSWQMFSPAGASVGSGSFSSSSPSIHLPKTTVAGVYLVSFASGSSSSVQVDAELELNTTLSANATVSAGTAAVRQSKRFVFNATAGDDLNLAMSGLALTPSSPNYVRIWLTRPDGYYNSFWCYTSSTPACSASPSNFSMVNMPLTGTYIVTVEPQGASTMSFGLTLSQDVTGTLTPGTPLAVSLPEPGRQAMLTFSATAGQAVALNVGSIATTPAGKSVTVIVYQANGSVVGSTSTSTQTTMNLPNLAGGTYSVLVAPADAAAATLQATLADGVSATVLPDGSTQSFNTSLPGQNAYIKFSATAGDDLALALTGLSLTPSSPNYVRVWVTRPDGYYGSFWCSVTSTPGCGTHPNTYSLANLPLTGTYTVTVEPQGLATMSFNLTLSQDVTGTLSPGTPLAVDLPEPGRQAMLTFSAAAGETMALNVGSVATTPAGKNVTVIVYQANGNVVGSTSTSTQSTMNLTNLAGGTYSVLVAPADAAMATMQATLANGVSATVLPDGSTQSFSTSLPSQNAYFKFSGTAGDDLSLTLTGLSLTPSSPNYVRVWVTRPDGYYGSFWCSMTSTPGCVTHPNTYSLANLPLTGIYTVTVEPQAAATMSFNLTLAQDVTGALTPGTPLAVDLPETGRQAMLTFSAAAGQTMALNVGSIATTPAGKNVTVIVYQANGNVVGSTSTSTQSTMNLTNLAGGTYSVLIAPADAATATMQVALANGVSVTVLPDGSTQSFSTSLPSQLAYIKFSATAGDDLGLALTGLSLTPSSPNYVRVYVSRPDGYYNSFWCYVTSTPGCAAHPNTHSLANLPVTGTYTITVEPQTAATMSFNLTLSQDVTGALTPGTPLPVSLPEPGRQAMLTFSATAGQTVPLTVSSVATTPAGKSVTVIVYRADGTTVASAATATQTTLNLTNLTAGTYSVLIAPADAATATLDAGIQ